MQGPSDNRLAPDGAGTHRQPRLVAVGTDFRQSGIGIRERLALGGDRLAPALATLRGAAAEGLILSTCNRTELYAVVEAPCREVAAREVRAVLAEIAGVAVDDVRQATTVRHGRDAVRHLFRVACGLESLVLGEPQILGQVRESLAAAQTAAATGPVLARLATDALRVGKKARTVTGIARNRLSVPHAAVDLADRVLGGLRGRAALVVGAGEMGELLAKLLRAGGVRDLAVANRTLGRAEALARVTGGRAVPLAALPDELARAEVAFGAAGVAAGDYLVGGEVFDGATGQAGPLVLVDLGVPRTFAPALAERPGIRLFDVDDLRETATGLREAYGQDATRAEALVDAATDAYVDWWTARSAAPAIAALRDYAEAVRHAELERALARLGHLSERDREVVAALSVGLVNKLLHGPVTRLRSGDGQAAAIAAARTLFELAALDHPPTNEAHHAEPEQIEDRLGLDHDERRRTA